MNTHRFHRRSAAVVVFAMLLGAFQVPASAAPPKASITVKDVSVTEGNAGSKILSFEVRAKGRGASKASVSWDTADGTATAASDYKEDSGTLFFSNGLRQMIHITVMGDELVEANETLRVNLSGATNAKINDPQGIGTIENDDAAQALPILSIDDDLVGEGNAGSITAASFEVTLSKPAASTLTVSYATADGTATATSDYQPEPSGTLTFVPGDTSERATVQVVGDDTDEGANETFAVTVTGDDGATVADGNATGTIIDDEGAPAVSIGDATVVEGNSGTINAQFEVTLSHASATDVTVDYVTAAGSAEAGADFNAVPASQRIFAGNGPLTQTVSIPVVGDLVDESDESFTVALSNIQGGLPADVEGKGLIVDDDTSRVRVVGDASTEGEGPVAFTVSLTRPHSQDVTVHYTTANGTAKAASDYVAAADSVSFASGATNQVVAVPVVDDAVAERSESFSLVITETVNAELGDGDAVGTILDEDRRRSFTKVSKRIRHGRILVRGRLSPAHEGLRMSVTLKKRKNGRWVKVRTKRPLLGVGIDVNNDGVLDSKYSTRFRNPRNTRRCRVIARFAGDLHHFPSKARRTFDC